MDVNSKHIFNIYGTGNYLSVIIGDIANGDSYIHNPSDGLVIKAKHYLQYNITIYSFHYYVVPYINFYVRKSRTMMLLTSICFVVFWEGRNGAGL